MGWATTGWLSSGAHIPHHCDRTSTDDNSVVRKTALLFTVRTIILIISLLEEEEHFPQ